MKLLTSAFTLREIETDGRDVLEVLSTCGAVSEIRPPPTDATIGSWNMRPKVSVVELIVRSVWLLASPTVMFDPPEIPAVCRSDWIWLCSAVSK